MPRTTYDQVPYESYPYSQTHPDRIATVATLLGVRPTPLEQCRVLELGCASGGNLIPMAISLPESSFVGIDSSENQVAEGRKMIEALGLKNIELRRQNILDFAVDQRWFDYILAHGVYSWVPPTVQEKILEICSHNLAPNGVAYVSYNTYPGWHMRGMIRDIMCYHAKDFTDALLRVKHARNLLDFLAKSVANQQTPYSLLLKNEVELIRNKADSYLFHDHMEEVNDPVYFHQFAERAAAKDLHYLGDVDLRGMVSGNYPPEIESVLQMLSTDQIHKEQYQDFLHNRMFRQSLLCRKQFKPTFSLRLDQLSSFHVVSHAKPSSEKPDIASSADEKFTSSDGVTLTTHDAVVKAAMVHLAEVHPRAVPFDALLATARNRLNRASKEDQQTDAENLGKFLVTAYATASTSLVELHLCPPKFAVEVSEKPIASPLARLQAEKGNVVTNLRHEVIGLAEFNRHLLRHLDGTHDIKALVEILAQLVEKGELIVEEKGKPVRDKAKIKQGAAEARNSCLTWLDKHYWLDDRLGCMCSFLTHGFSRAPTRQGETSDRGQRGRRAT